MKKWSFALLCGIRKIDEFKFSFILLESLTPSFPIVSQISSDLYFCFIQRTIGLSVLFAPTSRDFQLDQKQRKNQENPNGQPTCNCSSADFLPSRTWMLTVNFDQQIG
jgi:hypothetical protein